MMIPLQPEIMKVLVLQARFTSDPMLEHERRCFVAATGLKRGDLHFHNMVIEVPAPTDILAFDALILGGSGDFSVAERDQPFFEPVAGMLEWVVDTGFPTFGCCFGYQLLVDVLGGKIERDPESGEVGSFWVELSDEGMEDPLFGQLPPRFVAQMGHLDRASVLPGDLPNLAASERCPHQGLRVPGKPIWATQFHPELDRQGNLDRCEAYIKEYGRNDNHGREGGLPSPEARTILPKFLELVAD